MRRRAEDPGASAWAPRRSDPASPRAWVREGDQRGAALMDERAWGTRQRADPRSPGAQVCSAARAAPPASPPPRWAVSPGRPMAGRGGLAGGVDAALPCRRRFIGDPTPPHRDTRPSPSSMPVPVEPGLPGCTRPPRTSRASPALRDAIRRAGPVPRAARRRYDQSHAAAHPYVSRASTRIGPKSLIPAAHA